ncbi:Ig-like domain repeat protein [Curtobacterium flaccumfaciens pv. oortii]|uniref:Ig-like domain repeat protein n=1 Tax=Curtobacterium flaccumfaciens TaxID=2035 RepID=UPI001BDE5235|nr:Ig-like domain repeat protein [Curtobacterium flaccumfaciens]MBT1623764.1 Ig-like domain repeat protein [Curtobacterium flaccumfaciens pv. oortii]
MRTHHQGRAVARARKILTGVVVAGLAGVALVGLGATTASAAAPAQTTFVNEGFTGASAGTAYILPSTQSGAANVACLTAKPAAGSSNTGSVPTCAGATDADGSGALRLTGAENNQAGGLGAKQSVPITKGVDAVFDSYQYNGTSADGIVFYLAATDPYNPTVPAKIGYLGGSLGYSASTANNAQGLSHAYLGIGLDRFGNFGNREFGGTGCTTDQGTNRTLTANAVTVRGPGDGGTGYCVQSRTVVNGSLNKTGVTDRAQAKVPVEIVINPTSSALAAQENTAVSVPAGQYAVVFTSIGGTQQVVRGALPKLTTGNAANVDPSWVDPATGYPYKLTYGWVAGTGGQNDIHEVNYLRTTTAAGPVPVLTASTGGTATVAHAGSGAYTVTPTVSADGGSESQLVRTTTTFPTGVTPDVSGVTGAGWTCQPPVGQVVTCDQAVDAGSPVAPGTVLPTLSIPYTVTGAARSATISTVLASTDAEAVTVTRGLTVEPQGTTVTVDDATATVGDTVTLTAQVASSAKTGATAPTGTVTFTDTETGAVLCTATIVDGAASCDTSTSTVGSRGVTATYEGDADHTAATGTGTLTATKVPTAVVVESRPTSAAYGEQITLDVTGLGSGSETVAAPTGTIEYREGTTVLCTATLPDTSCVAEGLGAGTHTVTAVYSGDALHAGSTSVAVDLTVRKASATIGTQPGTGGGDPSDGGEPTVPDTTVTVTHGDTTTLDTPNVPEDATGTIEYVTDDGTVLCTATLPDTTCAIPADLPGGRYTVHAHYSGDDNYEAADGAPFELVVTAQSTALVASTDATAPVVGSKVRLTASGLPAGATGTVTFTAAGGSVLCTVTLPETTCETDALPVGTNTVTAAYSGDASFAASSSALEIVVAALPAVEPTPGPTDEPSTPETSAPASAPSATASATPAPTTTGALAFTGSPVAVGTAMALAAALLIAGLVLLMVRRTRAARGTVADTTAE